MDSKLKQLRWKCRRGMRELDTLLLEYLTEYYRDAETEHQKAFELILDMQDPELWMLVVGKSTHNNKDVMRLVAKLQNTHRT